MMCRSTSLSFFQTTPRGRILNRFADDIAILDEQYHCEIFECIEGIFNLVGTAAVLVTTNPWIALALPPVGLIYARTHRYFVRSSNSIQQLESLSRSPIYAWMAETLRGAVTVRAYGATSQFTSQHCKLVDTNTLCRWTSHQVFQWLTLQCNLIGNLVISSVALVAVLSAARSGPAVAGLMIRQAISVTPQLNLMVDSMALVENKTVSVDRLAEFAALPAERHACAVDSESIAPDWPASGQIELTDVWLKHRSALAPALEGVDLSIRSGEKIGVCGR